MTHVAWDQKLKPIVTEYVSQKVDTRSFDEVYKHISSWYLLGHISQEWVDGAYEALMKGRCIMFMYKEGKHYGWLTGDSMEQIQKALKKPVSWRHQ